VEGRRTRGRGEWVGVGVWHLLVGHCIALRGFIIYTGARKSILKIFFGILEEYC